MHPSKWKSSFLVWVTVCTPSLKQCFCYEMSVISTRHSQLSAALFSLKGKYIHNICMELARHARFVMNEWVVQCFCIHSPSVSSPFFFRSGRVGKQSRQGSVSTNNQGSVQRSAILQILNCLYNPHLSPHGCFNPSNGFFYGRSHLFRVEN